MPASPGTISRLLLDWRAGDQSALDKLTPLVYAELRRLARHYVKKQRQGRTVGGRSGTTRIIGWFMLPNRNML